MDAKQWEKSKGMKDGNKESTKEMLSSFRAIGGASLSILLASAAIRSKSPEYFSNYAFFTSSACFFASTCLSVYLFLITIPLLYNESPGIIWNPAVKRTAASCLLFFVIGTIAIMTSLMI